MADEHRKRDARNRLVPYDAVEPGFEAIFTGNKSSPGDERVEIITTVRSDAAGNEIREWPVFSWTWPGREKDWDQEILCLNRLQIDLGEVDEATRRIRAHIGSLVPCDSGFPVTVDELLQAIGRGRLEEPSFHNGCWCPGMWWPQKITQPGQYGCMETIGAILRGFLDGESKHRLVGKFPYAAQFVEHTFEWLGPTEDLRDFQQLMIQRVLLALDYFTESDYTEPQFSDPSSLRKQEELVEDLFGEEGRGALLDQKIAVKAGLPEMYPRWKPGYQETIDRIESPEKRALYETCCAIASGVHTLSDCHHNTFRYIENWIHGIGTGRLGISTRKSGTEKERLGRLLFGYVLGLDKWLLGVPMPFLLLDLGHLDFGFDPKNEILRVYAYLGEEHSAVKVWLAGCLWYTLFHSSIGDSPAGLIRHRELLERAGEAGVSLRKWMEGEKDEG